ncbi:hypothetical protein [Amycolatopsis sp. H20-H5]|uniref:hypothetical protein n=1 Tax=Amycolatopsis sp. H20-H5 TaxID=3046309 RepID=UPI002DB77B97|nr:hypothetical protein [Amycolatopsis sp. H20-H5]MEC3978228.1 hypothetical protein [Amycolatopsis sp. H20-H5]
MSKIITANDSQRSCAHPPARDTAAVAVALHAPDPMTELGATAILEADGRLTVLAGDDLARADVVVVVEESLGHGACAFLREVRALFRGESPPQCVIVTDHLQPEVLMTAIERDLAAILGLRTVDGDELVRTVFAVGTRRAVPGRRRDWERAQA